VQRRDFLKSAGVITVLVAGGIVWRAYDEGVFSVGDGPAYEPWKNWRSAKSEGPMALVRAAILAANPHNTQPWRFRVTPSRIDLFADTTRRIGTIDPYLREMYIGLGCSVENLLLAAAANGYGSALTLLPDPSNENHAARIDLSAGAPSESDLYRAIPQRHTNRHPYRIDRPISSEVLDALKSLAEAERDVTVFWFASAADRGRAGDLIVRATESIIGDTEQSVDSEKWYRFKWKDLQHYRDGITLDTAGVPGPLLVFAKMLPRQSREADDRQWLKNTRDNHVATAAAFGMLAVRDADDRAQRMRCGRAWQRMHLWATTQSLAMQPLNQVPEREARERVLRIEPRFGKALHDLVGGSDWQPLMMFRAGYPTRDAERSPRRSVEEVVIGRS
jgi:nitroreductase